MIIRIWAGQIMTGHVDEFCDLLVAEAIPQIGQVDGCLGGEVLRSLTDDGHRVLVITRWRDEEALRGYAGPMWRIRPIWAEGELRHLAHPPEVTHYTSVATA
ncbi:antibiotic biosynthesis monooxygenase family protein [Kitasatospora sp. NPDC050543]|uniref:antibiotic biosynthesis monooxygenase family protein n=1 Tax=Kitasatospora sp. NPDC050543 TaxID=3364054 RepID=UPI00379294F3